MVVVWGNILSLLGNVFAIAVDILVFDAFFPRNDNRKKRWSYILLFCLIFTSLSILIGTKLGYTFKMLQEIALIYVLCVFLYQSRWDRRFFIVVTVYSVYFPTVTGSSPFAYMLEIWTTKNIYGMFLYTPCYSSFAGLFPYLLH